VLTLVIAAVRFPRKTHQTEEKLKLCKLSWLFVITNGYLRIAKLEFMFMVYWELTIQSDHDSSTWCFLVLCMTDKDKTETKMINIVQWRLKNCDVMRSHRLSSWSCFGGKAAFFSTDTRSFVFHDFSLKVRLAYAGRRGQQKNKLHLMASAQKELKQRLSRLSSSKMMGPYSKTCSNLRSR
jgi:hypothetical protein